uniref:Putative secreted protein n=1 Tax=Anopheles darlingi TaxID=43151 RepID=A0A2M4DAI1_ANODA
MGSLAIVAFIVFHSFVRLRNCVPAAGDTIASPTPLNTSRRRSIINKCILFLNRVLSQAPIALLCCV